MERPAQNARLIRDIIPQKRGETASGRADDAVTKAPAQAQVIHYKELHLKPEQESRLQFYSELAAPMTGIQRVRRAKSSPSSSSDDQTEQQTLLSTVETSSLESAAEAQSEDDALYAMTLDDIVSEPTETRLGRTMASFRRIARTVRGQVTAFGAKLFATLSAVPLRETMRTAGRRLAARRRTILIAAAVLCAGLALYQFAYKPITNHSSQSAAQTAQWKKAQAQWQCTLRNYQAEQSGNNKEQSCVNK